MIRMRWFRRRPLPPPPDVPVHLEEAREAVDDALQHLADTRAKARHVSRTAEALRRIRAENDFARTISNALRP